VLLTLRLAVSGLMLVTVTSCADQLAAPPDVTRDINAAVQTDSLAYRLDQSRDSYDGTIGFVFTNRSAQPISVLNCQRQTGVTLQKLVDAEWVTAFSPTVAFCRSADIVIAPGASYRTSLTIYGAKPNADFEPKFEASNVPGVYRIVWGSLSYGGTDTTTVPNSERISNRFTLTTRRR
jgi:hypothetical protein